MRRIVSFVDHQSSANLLVRYFYNHFPGIPLGGDLPGDPARWGLFSHLEETGVLTCVVLDFKGRSIPERLQLLVKAREAWFRLAEEVGAPAWALPDLFRVHLAKPVPEAVDLEARPFFVDLSPEGLGLDSKLHQWVHQVAAGEVGPEMRPVGLEEYTDLLVPVLFRSNPDEVHPREWVLLAETLRRVSEEVGISIYVKGMGETSPGGLRLDGGRCYKAAFDVPGVAVPIHFEAQDLPMALDSEVAWDVADHPAQYGDQALAKPLEGLLLGRSQAMAWNRAEPWREALEGLPGDLLLRVDAASPEVQRVRAATQPGSLHWQIVTEPLLRLMEGEVAAEADLIRLPEFLLAKVLQGLGRPVDLAECFPQTLDYMPLSSANETLGSPIPADHMSQDGNWALVFSQADGLGLLRARKGSSGTPEQLVSMAERIRYQKGKDPSRHLPPTNRHWNLVRQGVVGVS